MTTYHISPDGLARLYHDLQDHFGTANATIPWIASNHWLDMALAELDTAYDNHDWDKVIEMALDEGIDVTKYCEFLELS